MTSLVEDVANGGEADAAPLRRKKPIRWLVLKDLQRGMRLLRTRDIDWIEAAGNYVYLHVGRERHLHRETLRSLAHRLDPDAFVRVHRSTIVHLSCIDRIEPWVGGDYILKLKTGAEVRLSRNFREEFERRVGNG